MLLIIFFRLLIIFATIDIVFCVLGLGTQNWGVACRISQLHNIILKGATTKFHLTPPTLLKFYTAPQNGVFVLTFVKQNGEFCRGVILAMARKIDENL